MNEPNENTSGDKFEQQAKALFDESVDELDAATLSRLNQGRQAALSKASRPQHQWSIWMPATGVAAAVLVAVMVVRGPGSNEVMDAPASDLEILLSEENIDMLEELEFYNWFDTMDADTDGDVI